MDLIATLQCVDQPGIVHAMTSSVLACQGNIIENQQFTDPVTNSFVMRTRFETSASLDSAHKLLSEGLSKFNPELTIRDNASPKRALIMVTKESHCLRDLLYLLELGELPIQIPLVVGNHEELKSLVESHGIKFKYLPVSNESKESSETQLLSIRIRNHVLERQNELELARFESRNRTLARKVKSAHERCERRRMKRRHNNT